VSHGIFYAELILCSLRNFIYDKLFYADVFTNHQYDSSFKQWRSTIENKHNYLCISVSICWNFEEIAIQLESSKWIYDFRIKTMFGSYLPPVICRKAHLLFTFFCVCLRIVVSNAYYVVFLFWFSSCFQFLWIVHFLLLLRYSLTFIYILKRVYINDYVCFQLLYDW